MEMVMALLWSRVILNLVTMLVFLPYRSPSNPVSQVWNVEPRVWNLSENPSRQFIVSIYSREQPLPLEPPIIRLSHPQPLALQSGDMPIPNHRPIYLEPLQYDRASRRSLLVAIPRPSPCFSQLSMESKLELVHPHTREPIAEFKFRFEKVLPERPNPGHLNLQSIKAVVHYHPCGCVVSKYVDGTITISKLKHSLIQHFYEAHARRCSSLSVRPSPSPSPSPSLGDETLASLCPNVKTGIVLNAYDVVAGYELIQRVKMGKGFSLFHSRPYTLCNDEGLLHPHPSSHLHTVTQIFDASMSRNRQLELVCLLQRLSLIECRNLVRVLHLSDENVSNHHHRRHPQETTGRVVCVLERCSGGTVHEFLVRDFHHGDGRLCRKKVMMMAVGFMKGVQALHNATIIHNNITVHSAFIHCESDGDDGDGDGSLLELGMFESCYWGTDAHARALDITGAGTVILEMVMSTEMAMEMETVMAMDWDLLIRQPHDPFLMLVKSMIEGRLEMVDVRRRLQRCVEADR